MGVLILVTSFFIVFGMTIDIWNISHLPKMNSNRDGNFSFVTESCEYKKRFLFFSDSVHQKEDRFISNLDVS
jgi:hypothetical protein